jgi:hypothetical protein
LTRINGRSSFCRAPPRSFEDDHGEEEQAIVSGHHVIHTQVYQRKDMHTADAFKIGDIASGNTVGRCS